MYYFDLRKMSKQKRLSKKIRLKNVKISWTFARPGEVKRPLFVNIVIFSNFAQKLAKPALFQK